MSLLGQLTITCPGGTLPFGVRTGNLYTRDIHTGSNNSALYSVIKKYAGIGRHLYVSPT